MNGRARHAARTDREYRRAVLGRIGIGCVFPALSIGLSNVLFWWNLATPSTLLATTLFAIAGVIIGHSLAAGSLRTPFVVSTATIIAMLAFIGGTKVAGLLPSWLPPESSVAWRDGAVFATISCACAVVIALLASRIAPCRPLPALILVASVTNLLLAHRGGAIHRPYFLADPAWREGWHPMLILVGVGVAAGLLATIAMLHFRRGGRGAIHVSSIVALAFVLFIFAPNLDLLSFRAEDPLGLAVGEEGRLASRDLLGLRPADGTSRDELDEMVPFRDEYEREGAETPVGVVVLHDDADPFGGVFYFRQVAFSVWNGRRLVRSLDARIDADVFDTFPNTAPIETALPPGGVPRRAIDTTVSLLRAHPQPPVLTAGTRVSSAPTADRTLFHRTFRARSSLLEAATRDLLGRGNGSKSWPDAARRTYLALPDDARYRQIADEAIERLLPQYANDPWAQALAVSSWLERNTLYSLRSKHASEDDPTGSYLFGDRIGYCVHLAHAGAFLLRSLGHPARVAAGYAYLASDRAGGSAILLRAGDAHAWAEIHIDGVGWIPIDPAPESLDPKLPQRDLDLQRLLGELARGGELGAPDTFPSRRGWDEVRTAALGAFTILLFGWAATGYSFKAYRRLAPRFALRDRRGRVAYRASLDRLAEVGIFRGVGETRETFAERAVAVSPSFREQTRSHLSASFGRDETDPARARSQASDVARQVAAHGGWRRIVGILSPWRFRKSR